MKKQKSIYNLNKGYSLVEVLIAIGLMGVGMAAIMAMQFSALTGYGTARDQVNAAEIARTIESVLKLEAMQWAADANLPTFTGAIHNTGTPFQGGTSGILSIVSTAPFWEWKQIITAPVDQRMVTDGLRRYCAFARAGLMHSDANAPQILQVQIAVIYPAGRRNFPGIDATNPYGKCADVDETLLNPTAPNTFEATGYRAAYFGTQISPRRRF